METFVFSMDVLSSTRRSTTVKKLFVTDFQRITDPLFVTVDSFSLVITYFLWVFPVHSSDKFIGQKLAVMMSLMPESLYKRHNLS